MGAGDTYVPFRSRTRRRRRAAVAAALGVVVLGAGLYGVVTLVVSPAPTSTTAACPAGTARPAGATATVLPSPGQITVNVYNSTARNGLAATTANLLKERGFTIGKVTNDPLKANLTVPAQVRGGVAGSTDMRVLAAEVSGAQMQPDSRTDNSVDLVLGAGFTALTAPDQVTALLHPAAATAAATHGACSGSGGN
ncbi:MAG TPA: LytR C-terminal domain-containing protein [Actinocrinis sp.]|nr:LytR C-terminal domain-containing protein [Actinocrinis sp.]